MDEGVLLNLANSILLALSYRYGKKLPEITQLSDFKSAIRKIIVSDQAEDDGEMLIIPVGDLVTIQLDDKTFIQTIADFKPLAQYFQQLQEENHQSQIL
ncbi:hypothetical protein [Sphingobacterium endophyticum]|uniref:hypothetical protein n=1 Tax=Sphingobacterium endophyticum TaxID=2546448 RepID=UPI0012E10C38|nr:hypothetical protein [Sphingobacterium endophyticum]